MPQPFGPMEAWLGIGMAVALGLAVLAIVGTLAWWAWTDWLRRPRL